MSADRRIAASLLALAAVAVLVVALDVEGPVRAGLALAFTLVAPGLALSLLMGPMSIEARLLVALAGSAALATVISLALIAAGAWSAPAGVVLPAAIVAASAVHVLRRPAPPASPPEGDLADPTVPFDPPIGDSAAPFDESPPAVTPVRVREQTIDLRQETVRRSP